MRIVDGNKISELILEGCKVLLNKEYVTPKLSIVMAGNNNSSLTYIEKKRQAGEKVGVDVEIHKLDNTNTQELVSLIGKLNEDSSVTGIILQLPLPKDINEYKICSAIDPSKDVDGLNPVSMGDIWLNKKPKIIPATVKAIDYILQYIAKEEGQEYHDYLTGKNILIINRSSIIGKPLAGILLNKDATVTLAHSKTKNLDQLIAIADIIVSGTGKEDFLSRQNFKKGAVLIDVGFNKTDKRVFGDVDKSMENDNISWLTPVPGGVGPVGVACLIENVVNAAFLNV